MQRDRERMNLFHLLVYSPKSLNSWSWAKSKPSAQNSVWVSYIDVRDPSTWPVACCLPWYTHQEWSQDSNLGTACSQTYVYMNTPFQIHVLHMCIHMPVYIHTSLKSYLGKRYITARPKAHSY